MKIHPPVVDYREFRLHKLQTEQFCHLKLLLFWPLFLLAFQFAERFLKVPKYYLVYTPLDDYIPFHEIFVIPYMFWFVYLIGMNLYTLLYDIDSFRRMTRFIIITYTAALVIFLLYPTYQNLRPETFARDNILTRFMAEFYKFDTNTNVCPSIHVIGSVAVWAAAWNAPKLQKLCWKLSFTAVTVLISLSTVFLKQHSVIDIIVALIICGVAYHICYRKNESFPRKKAAVR